MPDLINLNEKKIAVIGLGYVGLPLAVEFGKKRDVLGFDISLERIGQLKCGVDETLEVSRQELEASKFLKFSTDENDLKSCGIFLVTVPTPVDDANRPNLDLIKNASEMIARVMPKDAVVIFESTVYPGCTREICVPILEAGSGKIFNEEFFVGYSPERANPGDREHRLATITKVTAGSTPQIADAIDELYASIVMAGTHKASSIEVAEAAKVIENTQRDLNIALVNELAVIFERMGIDTLEVLEAAGTKWNFLPFRPGLVGGHCIGVDPYYLTHKAQELGYHPEVILAGRRINDGMAKFVADQTAQIMMKKGLPVVNSKILLMGLTFKENCPDLRNSKVVDVLHHLTAYNAIIDVYDPWANATQVKEEFGVSCLDHLPAGNSYDAVIITVGHAEFLEMGARGIRQLCKETSVIYDVKGLFDKQLTDGRL